LAKNLKKKVVQNPKFVPLPANLLTLLNTSDEDQKHRLWGGAKVARVQQHGNDKNLLTL
jgi:hypothetical protein